MATPSVKTPELEALLENLSGRSTAITADVCLSAPLGCGKPVGEFRDECSKREYTISGFCQECQDKVFGV